MLSKAVAACNAGCSSLLARQGLKQLTGAVAAVACCNESLTWSCAPASTTPLPRHCRGFVGSAGSNDSSNNGNGGAKSIFVAEIDEEGTSPVLLGLASYFKRHVPRVGFFKPVGDEPFPNAKSQVPRHVELMHSALGLPGNPLHMVGVPKDQAITLLTSGKLSEMLDRIYDAYASYSESFDVVIVEGPTQEAVGTNFVRLGAEIAASLGSPALLVTGMGERESASRVFDRAKLAMRSYEAKHVEMLGLVANMVPPQDRWLVSSQLGKRMETTPVPFLGAIPRDDTLASIRLDEVQMALGAKLMFGDESLLDRELNKVYVASAEVDRLMAIIDQGETQSVQGALTHRPLLICSYTRVDVIISLLAAHYSGAGPHVSALLLTGDPYMSPRVSKVIHAMQNLHPDAMLPILHTDCNTFEVANIISRIRASILPTSASKIQQSKLLFDRCIDTNRMMECMSALKEAAMTPNKFMHTMAKQCMANPQHIILPESNDKRVLQAAAYVTKQGIAKITLVGDPNQVKTQAVRVGADISECQIIDHTKLAAIDKLVEVVVEARKKKNMSPEQARDLLTEVNYFGTAAVMEGLADGMVSGACHTTSSTIRPGLQLLRKSSGGKGLVSSVFFMCLPDRIFVYGDCAVNVSPTAEELATIAITSADTARAFGIEPRVAMLSYSTLGSGAGPEVEKVTEATRIAREARPDLFIEGPIQYDAAVDPAVAATKVKGHSDVAGKATVLIFPDLNTGNNTYKAVQQSTGAIAIGPIMQGLDKPVNDLSRGCTVTDIINTIQCTAIQAIQAKQKGGGSHMAAMAA